jgi:hypothetical protein
MNGFKQSALAMVFVAGALGAIGCHAEGERYRNLVDPCWLERYSAVARQDIVTSFTPQVLNGRILDQTMFNYDFEDGSDKLHPMGVKKLNELLQRRPQPDCKIYLATAHDQTYDPAKAEEFGDAKRELDMKRVASIQKYLAAATVGRPMQFDVQIHDPADPSMSAVSVRNAILSQRGSYVGTLGGGAGSTTATGAGGGGGGAGYGAGAGAFGYGLGAGGVSGMGTAPQGAGAPPAVGPSGAGGTSPPQ